MCTDHGIRMMDPESSWNYCCSFRPMFIGGALWLSRASPPAHIVSQSFLVKGQKNITHLQTKWIPRWQLNSYNSIIVTYPQLLVNVDHVCELLSALKIRRVLKLLPLHTLCSRFKRLKMTTTSTNETLRKLIYWITGSLFSSRLPQLSSLRRKGETPSREEWDLWRTNWNPQSCTVPSVYVCLDGSWWAELSRFEPYKLVYLHKVLLDKSVCCFVF